MNFKFNANNTVTLTARYQELITIISTGQQIWAIPVMNSDKIAGVYVNSLQRFGDDRVVAHPVDFADDFGAGIEGWETLDAEERDEYAHNILSYTIPNSIFAADKNYQERQVREMVAG